jgi:hypothetical protein
LECGAIVDRREKPEGRNKLNRNGMFVHDAWRAKVVYVLLFQGDNAAMRQFLFLRYDDGIGDGLVEKEEADAARDTGIRNRQ